MYVMSRVYPVIDQLSQEALTIVSPTHRPTKRVKVDSSPRYSDRNGRYSMQKDPLVLKTPACMYLTCLLWTLSDEKKKTVSICFDAVR